MFSPFSANLPANFRYFFSMVDSRSPKKYLSIFDFSSLLRRCSVDFSVDDVSSMMFSPFSANLPPNFRVDFSFKISSTSLSICELQKTGKKETTKYIFRRQSYRDFDKSGDFSSIFVDKAS